MANASICQPLVKINSNTRARNIFFCLTSHGLAGNTSVVARIQDSLAHTLDTAQMRT